MECREGRRGGNNGPKLVSYYWVCPFEKDQNVLISRLEIIDNAVQDKGLVLLLQLQRCVGRVCIQDGFQNGADFF